MEGFMKQISRTQGLNAAFKQFQSLPGLPLSDRKLNNFATSAPLHRVSQKEQAARTLVGPEENVTSADATKNDAAALFFVAGQTT